MPHSDIPGSRLACSSPGLIAAYHVLHRLSMPRHSPCALFGLISLRSTTVSYFHLSMGFLPTSSSTSIVKERTSERERREEECGRNQRTFPRPKPARPGTRCSRKEVIQPQVPLRLPCYDFAPVTELTFGGCLLAVSPPTSGPPSFHGVTGGVYKARERIHRGVADPRLLAIPASCSRVADCNPNLDRVSPIRSTSRYCNGLSRPL